jgi:hypothetical protein
LKRKFYFNLALGSPPQSKNENNCSKSAVPVLVWG